VATELVHADLEGNAGAVGRLLEDHGERLAAQRLEGIAGLLQSLYPDSFVEDELDLLGTELGED